ncbi:MAG: chromosomal replication initiator protein DnaA [Clostridia bacterium]|nr:chromosomal replication initiator protein DnaA [Clostridia bacterium]
MPSQSYTEEIAEVWNLVKETLKQKHTEATVNLWFGDLEILSFEDTSEDFEYEHDFTLIFGIPTPFKLKIIKDRYIDELQSEFCRLLGFEVHIELRLTGSATAQDQIKSVIGMELPQKKEASKGETTPSKLPEYNFEYTFENFIVGSTNKFAHAACMAVANKPANYESDMFSSSSYNPLFIYGNSGLGKTHLMYATINRMKEKHPDIKIIYTKGEDFTNQMIASLTNKTMNEFQNRYRKCDVLLIDDIQFIAGKTSTQEEFFHTFNALYEERKQIILTSDRPPKDIKTLEDRLISRFEWGLLADIEPPDLELRIAIIKKKAEQVNVVIPDEVLTFLGENLRSNIRQIEGAIKKLGALSFLEGKEITMELAQNCLTELLGGAEPVSVTVDKIFAAVNRKYGISRDALVSPKRSKDIAHARHTTVFLIRELTEMSYPSLAKIFERDHATIISSYNLVATRILNDPVYLSEITELKKEIAG